MNWLITGGCGFIGTRLITRLLKSGRHKIRVIDNLSTGTREDLRLVAPSFVEVSPKKIKKTIVSQVELCVGDILNEELADIVTGGVDIIVHLAANTGVGPSVEDPRSDCLSNVIGTINYLEAARNNQVNRFIFASSGAPAGEVEPPIHENLPSRPVSPYGASKLAGEGYCSAYYRTFGIKTIALRFGNVYGPGSIYKSSVVAKFIRAAFKGETLEIYGDGNQTRDFIYIDDLISAIMASSKVSIGGEIFQIATNKETTISEIVGLLSNALANVGVNNIDIVRAQERLGDVKRNYSDTSKAKKMLSWQAETSLEEGVAKTIEYFMSIRQEHN